MGLEQLAAIRELLAKQAQEAAVSKKPARARPPDAGRRDTAARETPANPALIAIARLQRRFPKAFPKKPAPKAPLKVGVLEDLVQHAKVLQLSVDEIKHAIKTWCDGRRYWDCMVEAAVRVDLNGEPAGAVTASEAQYAKRLASRRHAKAARGNKAHVKPAAAKPIQTAAPLPAAPPSAPVQAPADTQAPD